MKTSDKAQHTPRLRTYSSRRHRDDSGRDFLSETKRAEIRKVLSDYRDHYKQKAAISDARLNGALDEVSVICRHYQNGVDHLPLPTATEIDTQKRSASSVAESAKQLIEAIDSIDDDTQTRMYQVLGRRKDSMPDKLAEGQRRFERCRQAILELNESAVYASTRPYLFYDTTKRQKSLPSYAGTYLDELVDVWCSLFDEGFRAPTVKPSKKARKKGPGIAPEHYGARFVITVLSNAGHAWPEGKIQEQLKRVREARTKTSSSDSRKSSESDQASRTMRHKKTN